MRKIHGNVKIIKFPGIIPRTPANRGTGRKRGKGRNRTGKKREEEEGREEGQEREGRNWTHQPTTIQNKVTPLQ
jgi:hypothetical protein